LYCYCSYSVGDTWVVLNFSSDFFTTTACSCTRITAALWSDSWN